MTQLCPEYLYCRFIAAKFKRRGKSRKFFSSKGIGSTDDRMIREFSPHSVFTGVVFVAHTLHIVSALKHHFITLFQVWKYLGIVAEFRLHLCSHFHALLFQPTIKTHLRVITTVTYAASEAGPATAKTSSTS